MTPLRVLLTAAAAAAVAATAAAVEAWQTVTLRGEAGLTIAIPAVAENKIGDKDSDDLLFIALTTKGHGDLVCMAHRNAYPKEAPQAVFAAALATKRREVFCQQDGATGLAVAGSESFDHHGAQAAICTASFTDSAAKLPGKVQSQMIVAAPGKAYFVTCTVEDEDQELAQYDWSAVWGEKVRHIQMSLRLPK